MTKQQLIFEIEKLDNDQQLAWMFALGEFLTISARNSYKTDAQEGRIEGVMGHNEIQHRIFARIRDLRSGKEWTVESFIDLLLQMSRSYGVAGDVGWAIKQSLA